MDYEGLTLDNLTASAFAGYRVEYSAGLTAVEYEPLDRVTAQEDSHFGLLSNSVIQWAISNRLQHERSARVSGCGTTCSPSRTRRYSPCRRIDNTAEDKPSKVHFAASSPPFASSETLAQTMEAMDIDPVTPVRPQIASPSILAHSLLKALLARTAAREGVASRVQSRIQPGSKLHATRLASPSAVLRAKFISHRQYPSSRASGRSANSARPSPLVSPNTSRSSLSSKDPSPRRRLSKWPTRSTFSDSSGLRSRSCQSRYFGRFLDSKAGFSPPNMLRTASARWNPFSFPRRPLRVNRPSSVMQSTSDGSSHCGNSSYRSIQFRCATLMKDSGLYFWRRID